jgi:uncharacterized SAM-binding protein YcdF (DUF218 family)
MFFFHATRVLPLFLFPLGLVTILLVVAIRYKRRVFIAAPLAILVLFGTPLCANFILGSLENWFPYRTIEDTPQADAVFVFGGMLDFRGRADSTVAWNEAAERFDRAIHLLLTGKARQLVLSGGAERYPGGENEGTFLRNEAISRGAPSENVLVTPSAANTKEEASAVCQLGAKLSWKRVLLVTSAYHMPRVIKLTQGCSFQKIPIPVAYRTPAPNSTWTLRRPESYVPQARALFNSELAFHEYFGMLF